MLSFLSISRFHNSPDIKRPFPFFTLVVADGAFFLVSIFKLLSLILPTHTAQSHLEKGFQKAFEMAYQERAEGKTLDFIRLALHSLSLIARWWLIGILRVPVPISRGLPFFWSFQYGLRCITEVLQEGNTHLIKSLILF